MCSFNFCSTWKTESLTFSHVNRQIAPRKMVFGRSNNSKNTIDPREGSSWESASTTSIIYFFVRASEDTDDAGSWLSKKVLQCFISEFKEVLAEGAHGRFTSNCFSPFFFVIGLFTIHSCMDYSILTGLDWVNACSAIFPLCCITFIANIPFCLLRLMDCMYPYDKLMQVLHSNLTHYSCSWRVYAPAVALLGYMFFTLINFLNIWM